MCEFLLDKGADVNRGGNVSKTMWLVCRWMVVGGGGVIKLWFVSVFM